MPAGPSLLGLLAQPATQNQGIAANTTKTSRRCRGNAHAYLPYAGTGCVTLLESDFGRAIGRHRPCIWPLEHPGWRLDGGQGSLDDSCRVDGETPVAETLKVCCRSALISAMGMGICLHNANFAVCCLHPFPSSSTLSTCFHPSLPFSGPH